LLIQRTELARPAAPGSSSRSTSRPVATRLIEALDYDKPVEVSRTPTTGIAQPITGPAHRRRPGPSSAPLSDSLDDAQSSV
jgi:hypothetical protein